MLGIPAADLYVNGSNSLEMITHALAANLKPKVRQRRDQQWQPELRLE